MYIYNKRKKTWIFFFTSEQAKNEKGMRPEIYNNDNKIKRNLRNYLLVS